MIKVFYVCLLSLIVVFIPPTAMAASCTVTGQNDFTISFTVTASRTWQYVRMYKNANQPKEFIWYTKTEQSGNSYIFNEPELDDGHTYEVKITHSKDTGASDYYLREIAPTVGGWEHKDTSYKNITNGSLYPNESSNMTITNIRCESIVNPPPIEPPPVFYQDARFKFGQVPAGECYNGCTINFDDIEFRTTPIVFLMSSINRDKLSDDNPSAAFVQSVGTESATIVQKMPLGFDNNEFGMEPIFYLVAEPGYVQFDPRSNQKALVNTIDTQLYQKAGGGDTGWENVVFDSSFGNNGTPIVLTQVQKLTQNDLWATSAIQTNSVSSSGFNAALELGRRNVFPSAPQAIGYIAALPQTGTTKNNEAFVFSAPSGTFRQPNSLSNSCNTNYLPLGDDFSSYGVILSKQSRTGGDGGWLRLCDLAKDDQFSFIFEEDYTDRKHGRPESVGFFAFAFAEPEPPVINLCKTFPNVVQSWSSTSLFNITNGGSKVYGTKEKLGGIGFNSVADQGQWQKACDESRCASEPLLLISEPNVLPFSSGPYLPFDPNNANLPPGKYDEIHLTGGDAVYELTGSYYEIRSLSLTGSAKFLVKPNTFIKVNSFDVSSGDGGIFDISGGSARGLVLWGEYESNIAPDIEISIKTLHADIFSRGSVTLTGGAILKGSITADYVNMGGDELRRVVDNCDTDNPIVTRIEIKPFNHHLICEDSPQNEVQVHIFDEENKLIGGYQPILLSGNSNLNITFLSESGGIAKYRVDNTVDEIGNFTLDASLVVDSVPINAEQNTISYVPYKFDIKPSDASSWEQQPISMTAGAGSEIDVRVLGCSGGSSAIVSNYSANLDNDHVEIKTSPVGGAGALTVSDMDFSDGSVSNVAVSFDNSGELTATIFDLGFDCSTQTDIDCPTYNGYLQGDFIIQARPWKIAVCDVLGESGETLSSPISGFISSGKPFDVMYKPIIYSDESQECSYPLATNYAEDSGPLSVVKDLVYPDPKTTSAILGTITPVTSEPTNFSPGSATLTVKYNWNEVGSLEFITPNTITYLGMTLDPYSQIIGRFYPEYFKVLTNSWRDPLGQDFTYMNQPFDEVEIVVAAYSALNNEVSNYASFNSNHQAVFSLKDNDGRLVNADAADLALASSYVGSRWLLSSSLINWSKRADLVPDGPFNVNHDDFDGSSERITSIEVFKSLEQDPVQFANGTAIQELPDEHPRVVFGRVNMNDVGGGEGSDITVPLQVQYWNGDAFVNNASDSFTDIDSEIDGSPTVIWPEGATTSVTLQGYADVKSGISNGFSAKQDPNFITREQVEIWQALNSTTNALPWLMFDWDQNGTDEENPSTVVTFGIYRGNDRVIYRGESGLTGQ